VKTWVSLVADETAKSNPSLFVVSLLSISQGQRGHLGRSLLALGLLGQLAADPGALKDGLTVLVELELGDDDVAGVDTEGYGLAGSLLAGDTLNVDNIFETVNGGNFALLLLVETTDDHDLVILADGDAANVVLLAQLLAERGAHDVATNARGSTEVLLARLAPRRVEGLGNLGHCD
jgi:hypothetical protein